MPEIDRWENEGGRVIPTSRTSRVKALQRRYTQLDAKLDLELNRPDPSSIEVKRLRRERAYLRDELDDLAN